jgi:hypothetical protein
VPRRTEFNNDFCDLEEEFFAEGIDVKDGLVGTFLDIVVVDPGTGLVPTVNATTGETYLAGLTVAHASWLPL